MAFSLLLFFLLHVGAEQLTSRCPEKKRVDYSKKLKRACLGQVQNNENGEEGIYVNIKAVCPLKIIAAIERKIL